MATEIFRTRMIQLYREMREPDSFLSGFFQVRPGNISDTEFVEVDIVRGGEDIAAVVNTCEGPNYNTSDKFTTKQFTPPTINEAMPFNCREFLKRRAGVNAYDAVDNSFQADLVQRLLEGIRKLDAKIARNREWQASQILQTGLLDLVDQFGNVVYQIDFKPKATHFSVVGTPWTAGGGDPLSDMEALADVIRDDSLQDVDRAIMGAGSFAAFKQNAQVQAQLDNRRFEIGTIAPRPTGSGGKFQGFVNLGAYLVEIWTFNGRGIVPGDASNTLFVAEDSCIMLPSTARLDTVFAGVPVLTDVDPRFADFLPSRLSVPQAIDLSPNIFATPNGKEVILEVESRPLLIPTAIDSFGRLDTGV